MTVIKSEYCSNGAYGCALSLICLDRMQESGVWPVRYDPTTTIYANDIPFGWAPGNGANDVWWLCKECHESLMRGEIPTQVPLEFLLHFLDAVASVT